MFWVPIVDNDKTLFDLLVVENFPPILDADDSAFPPNGIDEIFLDLPIVGFLGFENFAPTLDMDDFIFPPILNAEDFMEENILDLVLDLEEVDLALDLDPPPLLPLLLPYDSSMHTSTKITTNTKNMALKRISSDVLVLCESDCTM